MLFLFMDSFFIFVEITSFKMRYSILFLFVAFLFSDCKKQPEKTQPTVQRISESVYASGSIKSKNQYQVFATVAGLIQKRLVKEGDIVKKGDPLFIIQNETSKLNTENAKLAADFADVNTSGDRLNELRNTIELARSKMVNDSILRDRQRDLWAQQIGSKNQLEQLELAYTSSANNYRSAIFRYNDLQKQLKFSAEQSKKQLSISQTIAQDYIVRSQAAGRVYSLTKEVGEIVNQQTPLAIIGEANDFLIELQIDENDIIRVKLGQRTFLTLDSYKGQVFEARISKINPIMNERTRTFLVEAEFVQKPPTLYPNLTTEANILIQFKDNAITIPRTYLVADSLVILENNENRRVQTGLKDYTKVEIISGLNANETILKPGK